MCVCGGGIPKLKWPPPPPYWHIKSGGTSPEEKSSPQAPIFFFTKKWGAAGFPMVFIGGKRGNFLTNGGGAVGGIKNIIPKNRRETLKEQKNKKIPCAEGAQNFWENFGKKHLKLVFFLSKFNFFKKIGVFSSILTNFSKFLT